MGIALSGISLVVEDNEEFRLIPLVVSIVALFAIPVVVSVVISTVVPNVNFL